jgi:glycyl-tRNA synthetase alpha chain
MLTFQQLILKLNEFWDRQGCVLLQPYDMEVGAGTFHTATFLRAIGPEPWKAAYVQPLAAAEGRALWREPEPAAALLPVPGGAQALARCHPGALHRLIEAAGCKPRRARHPLRRGRLGIAHARRLGGSAGKCGSTAWKSRSSRISRKVGSLACKPVLGEITYGLERLAMYLQGKESVYDLVWSRGDVSRRLHQNEVEQSRYNFELSNTEMLFRPLQASFESEAKAPDRSARRAARLRMVMSCSHTFNLLDARGAISSPERAAYIGRVRGLARAVAQAYYESRERLGFPIAMPEARCFVELLTEELPPKSLRRLQDAFAGEIAAELARQRLAGDCKGRKLSPRRDASPC